MVGVELVDICRQLASGHFATVPLHVHISVHDIYLQISNPSNFISKLRKEKAIPSKL